MAHHCFPGILRTLVVTLLLIATIALLFLAALYRWQDRLLYFPNRAPLVQLTAGGLQETGSPTLMAPLGHQRRWLQRSQRPQAVAAAVTGCVCGSA